MKAQTLPPEEFYALLHQGNPGDQELYQELCSGTHSVLELGCGAGRLIPSLQQVTAKYYGIENNPALAAQAQTLASRENTEIMIADARQLNFIKTRFERILLPYNFLYCLGGLEGARQCLEGLAPILTESGSLWLDVYPVDDFHRAALESELPQDDQEPIAELLTSVGQLQIYENTTILPKEQRLIVEYQALNQQQVLVAEQSIQHDYLLQDQIFELLEGAGLGELVLRRGFEATQAPETAESEGIPGQGNDSFYLAEEDPVLIIGACSNQVQGD